MAKRKDEEEFGTGGKARDGVPNGDVPGGTAAGGMSAEDDELAKRRAERKNGDALADADLDGDDDGQTEMFPMGTLEGDPKVTIKSLIKAGMTVEYTASLMSAEVPLREGLLDPQDDGHQAMIRYEVAKIETVPIREDKGGSKRVKGYKLRQVLRPVYVEPIDAAKAPDAAAG